MAEIEFKRRGTPLWLVLLILLVVGAGAWFAFGRRPEAPTAAPATAPTSAAAPTTDPAAVTAPPAPTGPSAEFARFLGESRFPAAAAAQRPFLAETARKMADVLQEKAPTAGVQMILLRAVADTITMPDTKADRIADLTQLAMFAFAHALTAAKVDDGRLSTAAGAVQPSVPLSQQTQAVNDYLTAARELLQGGGAPTPAAPAAPAAPVAPTPRS